MWNLLIATYGIQFSDQGSNLGLLHWNHGVLAAGPQRKSPHVLVAPSVDRPHLSSQLSYMPTLYLGKTSYSPFATFWTLLKCHFVRESPPHPRLKQELLRPLDPWDMHDVIARFPSFVQGLFLASWPLCASKSQAHTDTQQILGEWINEWMNEGTIRGWTMPSMSAFLFYFLKKYFFECNES